MTRAATAPADHDPAMIRQVAEGLTMVVGPQEAAVQLRRLYGDRRAVRAVLTTAPAPVTHTLPARAPRRQLSTVARKGPYWL